MAREKTRTYAYVWFGGFLIICLQKGKMTLKWRLDTYQNQHIVTIAFGYLRDMLLSVVYVSFDVINMTTI